MLTDKEIEALAILLQNHTPVGRLSNMEVRTVLDFMQGRGYAITKPATAPAVA